MTVAGLIAQLQQMPQDLLVCINDEYNGQFYDKVVDVFHAPMDPEYPEDVPCVVITVDGE